MKETKLLLKSEKIGVGLYKENCIVRGNRCNENPLEISRKGQLIHHIVARLSLTFSTYLYVASRSVHDCWLGSLEDRILDGTKEVWVISLGYHTGISPRVRATSKPFNLPSPPQRTQSGNGNISKEQAKAKGKGRRECFGTLYYILGMEWRWLGRLQRAT